MVGTQAAALPVLLLACLLAAPGLGVESAGTAARTVVPAERKVQALVNPRRVLAEDDYDPTALPDYSSSCGPGQATQWQKTYCEQDSDSDASGVVIGIFKDETCTGETLASVSGEFAAELASLDECGKGTTSMVSTMGVCDGDLLVDQFFQSSDCTGEPVYNVTQTECKSFCVYASHTPEDVQANMGVCYNMPDQPIADCVCHETCATCGYYSEDEGELFMPMPPDCGDSCRWPNSPFDCMTCKDGLIKVVLFDDGMGLCVPPAEAQCFASPGAAPTANCTCHPSCGSCGYDEEPTNADNCLTCQVGLRLAARYTDGTGACFPPDMMVVVVNGTASDSDLEDSVLEVDLWLAPAEVSQSLVVVIIVAGVLSVIGLVVGKMISKEATPSSQEVQALNASPKMYGTVDVEGAESTPLVQVKEGPEDHCTY